jgi:hypothetical protein
VKTHTLILAAFALAACGCATAPNTGKTPPAAIAEGERIFGGSDFDLAWIPSDGAIADATFISLSAGSPSALSHDLGRRISKADTVPLNLVVAGPNSSKSKSVLLGALSLTQNELPKLRVLFIGSTSHQPEISAALAKIKATLVEGKAR